MKPFRIIRQAGCLALFVAASAAPVLAQTDDSRITLSGAGGISIPVHGDLDFTAPAWQIAVRGSVSRHFLLEGFFEEWRHETEDVLATVTQRTTHTMKTVGVNWLGRGFVGRAAFTGGGGIGFMQYDRRFEQSANDCPGSCQEFDNRFTSQSFTFQGVAGVDVPITSVFAAFGQCQFVVPIEDVGFSHSSVTGGVRVRIW